MEVNIPFGWKPLNIEQYDGTIDLDEHLGTTVVHIRNLNPKVALHSMLLALCPDKFIDSLCKKPPSSMDELCERAKGYIQLEEMSKVWNEVYEAKKKHEKHETHTKLDSHKLDVTP